MCKESTEITHEEVLTINGIQTQCFVLSDGTRVLSGRGLQVALKIRDKPKEEGGKRGGYILPKFFESKALKPFMDNKLEVAKFKPILCYRGEQVIHGFEATLLAEICDAILQARKEGVKMTERQIIVADQAEMIIRSFAKVGIIALVDEATGFQTVRPEDALQQFLQKFLDEEKGKWVLSIQPEFFEAIFKMKGWTWKQASTKKTQVAGHYINNYVYFGLASQVLTELRKLNPKDEKGNRKGKYPQCINPEFGHPKLKEHYLNLIRMVAHRLNCHLMK